MNELHWRRLRSELLLKEKIRAEVEQRKRDEILEKEKRKIAAEVRRAAVLDRIRLQKELEEQKEREAMFLVAKEQAEAEQKLQKQLQLLMAERNLMELEDERSEQVEIEFREKEQQAAWHRREAEQLRNYEREQQQRDEEERRKQGERLQELEEKKRRLQEMQRRTAGSTSKTNSEVKKTSGEEAAQLARQLRIQNRAKFVTKRFESAPSVVSSTPTPAAPPADPPTIAAVETAVEGGAFSNALAAASCESELRLLANDLMAEKRSLRQEQRAMDAAEEGTAAGPSMAVDSQLAVLEQQEQAVQRRMDSLLRHSDPSLLAAQLAGVVGTAQLVSSLNSPQREEGSQEGPQERDLFQQAEALLQEGHTLLKWVQSEGQHLEEPDHPQAPESSWQRRRIAVLPLEIAQLTRGLARLLDPIDYRGRLDQLHAQLRQALTPSPALTHSPEPSGPEKESLCESFPGDSPEETVHLPSTDPPDPPPEEEPAEEAFLPSPEELRFKVMVGEI